MIEQAVQRAAPRRTSPWQADASRRHSVQFYDDEEFLVAELAAFVRAGLAASEAVVVVATTSHLARLDELLRADASAFDRARVDRERELVLLDARETLEGLLVGGAPDRAAFRESVGRVVARAGRRFARVRAFGEMVGLLAAAGDFAGAARLEVLWSEMLDEAPLALVCAYPMSTFARARDSSAFELACAAHDHVAPTESVLCADASPSAQRELARLEQRARSLSTETEERTRVEHALRRRERELEEFLENAAEGLHALDPSGTILWANRADLALLGYGREEFVGHDVREFYVERDAAEGMLARLACGERLFDEPARLRCKDGSIKHVLIHSNPYREDGRTLEHRCFTRDVTRRVLLQAELQEQVHHLAEADRRKDEFVATLSHELRTPLNAILGWAQVLRSHPSSPERIAQGLEVIERNARAQARLVADLLDTSRIVSGRMQLDLRRIELAPLIEATLESIEWTARAKELALVRRVDPRAGAVLGDAARLQQVLANLVSNAVKFARPRGTIVVELERAGSELELRVRDDGAGISAEFLPHVFERFRQKDGTPTRRHGGLGLGLAIVRALVEHHGGRVEARSAGENQGATFVVRLPRTADETVAPAPPCALPALPEAPIPASRSLRVLLVDDDADGRELVRHLLESHGVEVATATCAADGLELVHASALDVLVSDIAMPACDGYEFLRSVRASGSDIPAIALTAFAGAEAREQALRSGYAAHVSKPVDELELLAALRLLAARPRATPSDTGRARG